ncbi:hypothetical protein [Paraburkholderia atlantica]|uniref:hypothetical protein n=1 Tax=Paraburkholderia atlantica TaxID=2654982 RepID=UPI001622A621|nr:hypothetical protein [Paraburkholderia atlantica]MBB5510434.1 hypothetical protein [Paraburkholderia atlantica]
MLRGAFALGLDKDTWQGPHKGSFGPEVRSTSDQPGIRGVYSSADIRIGRANRLFRAFAAPVALVGRIAEHGFAVLESIHPLRPQAQDTHATDHLFDAGQRCVVMRFAA